MRSLATPCCLGNQTALCKTNDNCAETQACNKATSTCGECNADADCVRPTSSHYICDATHACQKVDCVKDTDCFDAKCNPETHTCAECLSNSECKDPYQARCDGVLGICTYCKADADCAHLGLTTCDPVTQICTN